MRSLFLTVVTAVLLLGACVEIDMGDETDESRASGYGADAESADEGIVYGTSLGGGSKGNGGIRDYGGGSCDCRISDGSGFPTGTSLLFAVTGILILRKRRT